MSDRLSEWQSVIRDIAEEARLKPSPTPEIDELRKAAEELLTELDSLLEIEKRNVFGDVGCEKIESLRAALEKK